jgi:hypothetical protein
MQRTPALSPSPVSTFGYGDLSHVSCAASNVCMAVGSANGYSRPATLVERYS